MPPFHCSAINLDSLPVDRLRLYGVGISCAIRKALLTALMATLNSDDANDEDAEGDGDDSFLKNSSQSASTKGGPASNAKDARDSKGDFINGVDSTVEKRRQEKRGRTSMADLM
eukprot:4849504-Prymnesium_polylepis.1